MKKLIFIILVLQGTAFSQKEFNNWYFGSYNMMTFNTSDGNPIVIKPYLNLMFTEFLSASISDYYGNFLFYSDGMGILNKNFNTMDNADSTLYMDVFFNSVYIIQKPKRAKIYYIITDINSSSNDSLTRLNCFTVNISLNNGLGKLIKKSQIDVGQHIIPIRHFNGRDLWLVGIDLNDTLNIFNSRILNENGISDSIKSHNIFNFSKKHNLTFHTRKSSRKGDKLAFKISDLDTTELIALYQFDNTTGKIFNQQLIDINKEFPHFKITGIEFSPNGNYLYVTLNLNWWAGNLQDSNPRKLIQFSLDEENNVTGKSVLLDTMDNYGGGVMQLGPNDKIYITNPSREFPGTLAVINFPDSLGLKCGFINKAIRLNGQSLWSLPTAPFVNNDKISLNSDDVCEGEVIRLSASLIDTSLKETYEWFGPDNFYSIEKEPYIINAQLNMAGFYKCVCKGDMFFQDSIYVTIHPKPKVNIHPGNKIFLCFGDSTNVEISTLDSTLKYMWSTGETGTRININATGKYLLLTETTFGCSRIDTIDVIVYPKVDPEIVLSGSSIVCSGDSVILKAFVNDTPNYSYLWSTGDTLANITVKNSGIYKLILTNKAGCSDSSEVKISVLPLPKVSISALGNTNLCDGDSVLLKAIVDYPGNYSVLWNTGDTTESIVVHNGSLYQVRIIDDCGNVASDSIQINTISFTAEIKSSGKLCENSSIKLQAYPLVSGMHYLWSTGDTTDNILINKTGKYTVTVTLGNSCSDSAEIFINENKSPQPAIAGDTMFCAGTPNVLTCEQDFVSYNWSTGENGKQITVTQPGTYSVTVTDTNGCTGAASVKVENYPVIINGLQDLTFGKVISGSSLTLKLTLRNDSKFAVRIKNIYLRNNSPEFIVQTTPSLPLTLAVNETIDIAVIFKPLENKKSTDSLILELDSPCTHAMSSYLSGETDEGRVFVWLPDTTGSVGEKNFCIPLRAIVSTPFAQTGKLGYTARIKYDATALLPDSLYAGYIIDGERYIDMADSDIVFQNGTAKLGEFCGTILLANQDITPLYIDKFEWNQPGIETDTKDGSLSLTGVCSRNISRIILFDNGAITLTPNPASDYITISLPSDAHTLKGVVEGVRLYDVFGQEEHPPTPSYKEGEVRVDVSVLPAGVYFVRVGEKVSKFVKVER